MAAKKLVLYVGTPPAKCDSCGQPITNWFADARSPWGPWGNVCKPCWFSWGAPSGVGQGQVFEKFVKGEHAGKFRKTRG
jgi:hypothetical protein